MHTTLALVLRESIDSREGNGIYRRTGSGVSLAISHRGRQTRCASRSDTQTTMLIQVHLDAWGRGPGSRRAMRCGSVRVQTLQLCSVRALRFGSRRAMRMAQYELCGCADVRMAHEEQCGIGSVADDERFREGNYQRLNPRMRQAISSGLRASMSKAVRWSSSAVVARRFRTSARSTKSSFFT